MTTKKEVLGIGLYCKFCLWSAFQGQNFLSICLETLCTY